MHRIFLDNENKALLFEIPLFVVFQTHTACPWGYGGEERARGEPERGPPLPARNHGVYMASCSVRAMRSFCRSGERSTKYAL